MGAILLFYSKEGVLLDNLTRPKVSLPKHYFLLVPVIWPLDPTLKLKTWKVVSLIRTRRKSSDPLLQALSTPPALSEGALPSRLIVPITGSRCNTLLVCLTLSPEWKTPHDLTTPAAPQFNGVRTRRLTRRHTASEVVTTVTATIPRNATKIPSNITPARWWNALCIMLTGPVDETTNVGSIFDKVFANMTNRRTVFT